MEKCLTIFHGSQNVIETPEYGFGKRYNDFGLGFYCTENFELAKEWACPMPHDGYANRYKLNVNGLNVMRLTESPFNILNWLALLLSNRTFDISSGIAQTAKEYLINHFLPDISEVDVLIGYRADDSYFSFASDFINNVLSLRDLNLAMQLGNLGEQIVLLSKQAFDQIEYLGSAVADHQVYLDKRKKRDTASREAYRRTKMNLQQLKQDIYVLDIIREEMRNDDPRLQCVISRTHR